MIVIMNLKTIVLTLMLVLCATVHGANVKIHGTVTDDTGAPVEFVTVRIGGSGIGTNTGLQGEYSLTCPSAPEITVFFSCIGYREEKKVLSNPSGDVTLDMKMHLDTKMLDAVEIQEIKKQTGSMTAIDASTAKLAPDASGSGVEALLGTMAGVTQSNEMSSQYSVRGGSYDENSVYINGTEIYRPQLVTSGEQEGLSVINPDMVEAIGFSTGGFTAEYGDKMSSVLDIKYRQPQAFEGAASLSLMGGSLTLGQHAGKFSQLHGLRYKRNASLLSSMETKGEYDPRFFDYQTSIGLQISPKFGINFLGNISTNHYKFTPTTRTTTFGTAMDAKQFTVYFDGHEKDVFETYFGALSLNWRPSRGTTVSFVGSGYLTNELVAYDISGEYWLDAAGTGEVGGELGVGAYKEHARNRLKASVIAGALKGSSMLGTAHTLGWGLGLQGEKIMDRSREWELRDSSGYSLPATGDAVKMIYNLSSRHDVSSTRFSAYVQDAWKINTSQGFLTVNGGVRMSYWSFNKEFLVSPRFNVGFIPAAHSQWAFRFATGLYYQAPFYKEYRVPLVDDEGNTTISLNDGIKSQRSFHIIGGTDYTFRAMGRPFKFSAEAYYKALGNLVPYEVDNLKITYTGINQSKGYTCGLDMKIFGQFVPGSDSWLSFSLMKTSEDLFGKKVPRPTDRRYSLGLFFTDYFPKFPKLKFSLKGLFSDGLPVTSPRSSRDKMYFRTPPYKRVDIGLSYALLSPRKEGEPSRFLKSVWLGVDVFNLLDISNVSSYYWVTDVNDIQYAVPNYLTRRQFNVRLSVEF